MTISLIEPSHCTEEVLHGKIEILGHFNLVHATQWAQGGHNVKLYARTDEGWEQIAYEHKKHQCGIVFEEDLRFASGNKPSEWALI